MVTIREKSILAKLTGCKVGDEIKSRGAAVGLNVKAVIASLCDDAYNELFKEDEFRTWYAAAEFDDDVDEIDRECFQSEVVNKDKDSLKLLMLMLDPEWADPDADDE